MAALSAHLSSAWNRFWFSPGSTQSLGLFRIFYGAAVLLKMVGVFSLSRAPHWRIRFPKHRADSLLITGPPDVFRDPMPGFEWLPSISPEAWGTFEVVVLIASVLFIVGLFTRASTVVLWLFFVLPMLYSRIDYFHHTSNFATVLGLAMLLPLGDHYSLDRLRSKTAPPKRTMLSVRMLQVFVAWIYLATFAGKFNPGWFQGTVMQLVVESGMTKGPFAGAIVGTIGIKFLSWYTLFAEGFLGVGIWFSRTRKWAIFFAVTLHLGIDAMMNVTTFSYQMWALYIVFIDPRSERTTVFYDVDNPRQRVQATVGRLLDWLDRVKWVGRSAPGAANSEGLIVERPDGTRLGGWLSFHELTGLFPATFLPSMVLAPFAGRRQRAHPVSR